MTDLRITIYKNPRDMQKIKWMIENKSNLVKACFKLVWLTLLLIFMMYQSALATKIQTPESNRIKIIVEKESNGAPLMFGVPFPKESLYNADNVRVLDANGKVIPAQINEVNTWLPANNSIQWVWVFFFSNGSKNYTLEYGPNVINELGADRGIVVSNHWTEGGEVKINTGKMEFALRKGVGGFLNRVSLNDASGKNATQTIATEPSNGRGNFMDILDDKGIDMSRAEITFIRVDKGSGPMHTILHVEGVFHYDQKEDAPFETKIHVYKDKTYLKVLNTIIYTGVPTKHPLLEGQHNMIAISDDHIINEDSIVAARDVRWTQPGDQISGMGLNLMYDLGDSVHCTTSLIEGDWWQNGTEKTIDFPLDNKGKISIFQTGDNPKRMPPLETSTEEQRMGNEKFTAVITGNGKEIAKSQKGGGWLHMAGSKAGVGVGIRNFFEEYPKEIAIDADKQLVQLYAWSPKAGPMGFEIYNDSILEGGEFDNFAQGLAKTTESVLYFHNEKKSTEAVKEILNYFMDPPVAHAEPQVYADSKVFGDIAVSSASDASFERALQYKFEWMMYNQKWEPWYGMWDYGEMKNYFFNGDWHQWSGNEPAQDYMWWLQFIRTGNRKLYLTAESMSRFTMDIDQVHWPKDPVYIGETNPAIDYWKFLDKSKGSPYVGMGRRHAPQHWISLLSAHVWVPGWIVSYFLTGDQRALEVAELTGDYYTKRIWGEHGLTGRRLYLSVWNLAWLYNATKEEKYGKELDFRVNRMLALQRNQQGNLVRDRYDYAQAYAAHGLADYLNFTNRDSLRIVKSIVENARRLLLSPPWGHEYESFLATIYPVMQGYKYTGNTQYLRTAQERASVLKMDKLSKSIFDYPSQGSLIKALEKVSHLPKTSEPYERIENGIDNQAGKDTDTGIPIWQFTSGIRVFAWTHMFNMPWLMYYDNK